MDKLPSIVQGAWRIPEISKLAEDVALAGLVETLKGDGPFTVFAPSNSAIDKIPIEELEKLMSPKNVKKLKTVLLRHVVPETIMFDKNARTHDVKEYKTVGGDTITVTIKNGSVKIKSSAGEATVIKGKGNLSFRNGVIHIVDSVF